MLNLLFYPLFAVLAFLYAAVGHGGASGYIALMVMAGMQPEEVRTHALVLNLFVSLVSFGQFFENKTFPKKLFGGLVLASVPMAFVGGLWKLDTGLYKVLLGLVLILPVLRLLGLLPSLQWKLPPKPLWIGLAGGGIGLLSGLLGIGGGILLSPLLLLLGWAGIRQTAALSAAFIFVNSAAGLAGNSFNHISYSSSLPWMLGLTLTGGLLGGYFGAKRFSVPMLQKLLAVVLAVACFKLFTT